MSITPAHGVQILKVKDGHKYELDEEALSRLVLREEVRELPVAVVSVAGPFRAGKSFLLNYFLRYLSATESARADGSWLGQPGQALGGFSWRGGSERDTTGLVMWSEPFVLTTPIGKVAVVVVDTQGAWDSSSTVRDNSTVFALATLLASDQIYNLSHDIRENALQQLQLFTDYGRLLKQDGEKAFQQLTFLIRDWTFPYEHPFGFVGGKQVLQKRLEVKDDQPKEIHDLHEHIKDCFENIFCFLLAHPGLGVTNADFNGDVALLSTDFKNGLKEFITTILDSAKLKVKTINGEPLKAGELLVYAKQYVSVFNVDQLPTPASVLMATSQASLQAAFEAGKAKYTSSTQTAQDHKRPALSSASLAALHRAALSDAVQAFADKKKIGTIAEVDRYTTILKQYCTEKLQHLTAQNAGRVRKAVAAATRVYTASVEEEIQSFPYLRDRDVDDLHLEGVRMALAMYDHQCERIDNDSEREQLIQEMQKSLRKLHLTTRASNTQLVTEMADRYRDRMSGTIRNWRQDITLSEQKLFDLHNGVKLSTLQDYLENRRTRGLGGDDNYLELLRQKIQDYYNTFAAQNRADLEIKRRQRLERERHQQEMERQRRLREEEQRRMEEQQERLAEERRRLRRVRKQRQREAQRRADEESRRRNSCTVL